MDRGTEAVIEGETGWEWEGRRKWVHNPTSKCPGNSRVGLSPSRVLKPTIDPQLPSSVGLCTLVARPPGSPSAVRTETVKVLPRFPNEEADVALAPW